jgi:hypothetical protein
MSRLHKTLALLIIMLFIASTTVFSQNNLEVSGFNFSGITNYHVFIENLTVSNPNSNLTYKNIMPLNCNLNLKQKEFVNVPFASVTEIGYKIENGTSTNIPIQPSDEGWHYFTAFNETFKITIQSMVNISTLTNGAHNLTIFANGICNIDNDGITSWNSSLAPIEFYVYNSASQNSSALSQGATNQSITFSSGVTLYSPLNITYTSNVVYCNGSFSCPNELLETLNYTLDEKYLGFLPWKIDMATLGGPINYFNGSIPLPNLSDGSHKISIGVKEELWDGTHLVNKTTWINTVYFTVNTNQSQTTPTSNPSPTVPELSIITIIPLLGAILVGIITVIIKRQEKLGI